jgi:hypothetical protein
MHNDSLNANGERVLVYTGLSLNPREVTEWIPDAVVRPPARQSDILSDLYRYRPTHLLLIDGKFRQDLSPWVMELVHALDNGVQVYGAASIGALRAVECQSVGMIGCGRIYDWYREGVIDDDACVAMVYQPGAQGECAFATVPDVDLFATLEWRPDWEPFILRALEIPWWERLPGRVKALEGCPEGWEIFNLKRNDALELVRTFRELQPETKPRASGLRLSILFDVQLERERRVKAGNRLIPLQDIDATVALNCAQRHEVFGAATNRALCLALADVLAVTVSVAEIEQTAARFRVRKGLVSLEALQGWLERNCLSPGEFNRLMFQEARICRLQRARIASCNFRRRTQDVLDYLRLEGEFEPWAQAAASRIPDELADFDPKFNEEEAWKQRSLEVGAPIDRPFDPEWVREFGFGRREEVRLQLQKQVGMTPSAP